MTNMNARKYWINEEIYVFAIDDTDQRKEYPTKTDYYIGRKEYGDLIHTHGLADDTNYPEDEEKYISGLVENGFYKEQIEELMNLS